MPWVIPLLLLGVAYSLLWLTLTRQLSHNEIMQRCVLVNPNLARIWSVGHIEIGLAYAGVFASMTYHIVRAAASDTTHRRDLLYGAVYVIASFLLDFFCVYHFQPFVALLVGDAIVMTFTLVVSRQVWFQRLLGIFVPFIFFSCAVGHFLEGVSYWKLTYPLNVPWTMVTADVGFAVLVNASRFPAFIKGQDITDGLAGMREDAAAKHQFLRDMLLSATRNRLNLCDTLDDLPRPLPLVEPPISLSRETLAHARRRAVEAGRDRRFSDEALDAVQTAVGEAAMNAIVHGSDGELTLRADSSTLQIWVVDHGEGVRLSQLPRTALAQGYSTAGAEGQGFSLMLNMASRLDLLTSRSGTTIVLTIQPAQVPAEPVAV